MVLGVANGRLFKGDILSFGQIGELLRPPDNDNYTKTQATLEYNMHMGSVI